jgi:hypothetical protein
MTALKLTKFFDHHRERRRHSSRLNARHIYDMEVVQSLWARLNVEKLTCCHCGESISFDSVLARTFKIKQPGSKDGSNWSEKIDVPSLSAELLVYHRHLECLQNSTSYVAVSHVWHPDVSELQYKRQGEPDLVAIAVATLLETPTRICKALAIIDEDAEVWHDYISVPQWQHEFKSVIIQDIPRIFNHAKFVVLHLSDIDHSNIKAMRQGTSTQQIARGISNICNATYFSRVWTAMEYTQSRAVRVILKGYIWVDFNPKHPFLVRELMRTWDVEVTKNGHPTAVERMVGMGYNLVPWQLGPLQDLQDVHESDRTPVFATAYGLLSRRTVTIQRDLFHALIGTLKLNGALTEASLSKDNKEALMQVARHCLSSGDLSPLFMIPASSQNELDESVMQQYGYVDTVTWGMGDQLKPATYRNIKVSANNVVILQAEDLGIVKTVRRESTSWMTDWESFSVNLKIALESTADLNDLDTFIDTLGGRFYGVLPAKIHERLAQESRRAKLQDSIRTVYNAYPLNNPSLEQWIADAMGLSNTSIRPDFSPMASMSSYHGSLHLGAAMAYITTQCCICHVSYIIRIAGLKRAADILGAKAYRVPGLRYLSSTLPGGAGFLLKNGHIIGRIIWGTPTCNCDKLRETMVKLEELPMPRPNRYVYGSKMVEPGAWLPLQQEARIKF